MTTINGYEIKPGADLYGAKLSWANLSGADLSWANLSGAKLSWANLSGADLSWANLTGADLARADLYGAKLSWANLSRANLYGACLYGTILDPQAQCNMIEAELFKNARNGCRYGYRTRNSPSSHNQWKKYEDGEAYRAPYFDTSDRECSFGLYVCPTVELAREWGTEIIKVKFRKESLHKAGNKWRVKSFVVIGGVK
jgi:hypothetical protein